MRLSLRRLSLMGDMDSRLRGNDKSFGNDEFFIFRP
jgi:hypothetical protein